MKKVPKSQPQAQRILIVDDHPVVCRGLQEILNQNGSRFTFSCAADDKSALAEVRRQHWDLIFLNVGLADSNGLEVLKEIRLLRPDARVLIFSGQPEQKHEVAALRLGAAGFVSKRSTPEQILLAARKILDGGTFVSRGIVAALVGELNLPRKSRPEEVLSQREHQILCGLAAGKTMKEIAFELRVSPKTVCTYRARLCGKLSVNNNAAIVRYALEHGLVS